MPSITEGLTYADESTPGARAPEAPISPEQERETARIREQSAAARETPSDPGFNKEAIAAELLAPRGIEAGIETADEAAQRAADERFDKDFGPDSEAGQALAEREHFEQLGRAAARMADVIQPAFNVLASSWDDEERALALTNLTPPERHLAKQQGLLDDEEEQRLVQIGAEVLDTRMRVHGEMQAALAEMSAVEDRLTRWTPLRSELGLDDDRNAEEFLLHVAARVRQDTDGRQSLATLPGPQWEAAIRAVAAQLRDTQRAHETARFKQQIVDEDLGDVASGLTQNGVPARPRDIIQPRFDPAGATDRALARGRVETDDEIRASVLHGHEPTSVAENIMEGGEQIPAATAAKMKALGF